MKNILILLNVLLLSPLAALSARVELATAGMLDQALARYFSRKETKS